MGREQSGQELTARASFKRKSVSGCEREEARRRQYEGPQQERDERAENLETGATRISTAGDVRGRSGRLMRAKRCGETCAAGI